MTPRRPRPLTWPTIAESRAAEPPEAPAAAPEASESSGSTAEPRLSGSQASGSESEAGSAVVRRHSVAVERPWLPAIEVLHLEPAPESDRESSEEEVDTVAPVAKALESCFAMHMVGGKFRLGREEQWCRGRNRSRVGFWWLE